MKNISLLNGNRHLLETSVRQYPGMNTPLSTIVISYKTFMLLSMANFLMTGLSLVVIDVDRWYAILDRRLWMRFRHRPQKSATITAHLGPGDPLSRTLEELIYVGEVNA